MNTHRRTIIWQGWKLELPRRWDPVKLEGNHAQGHALFADTLRPRLGLRWQTPRQNRRFDPETAVQLAMRNEVGQLAADEARPMLEKGSEAFFANANEEKAYDPFFAARAHATDEDWAAAMLYVEPDPPGRDVFCGFSEISGRLLQVAYHAHRREHVLAGSILPTLADYPLDRAAPWSVFDLNCIIPADMHLKSQQLNAGDLGLIFADRFNEITVRQIAVATLALQRQSLDGWIADQQKTARRYHHPTGVFADTTVVVRRQELPARISRMHRRARYGLMWNQPRRITTLALHDAGRDRLVLVHGTDESLLRQVVQTVGML